MVIKLYEIDEIHENDNTTSFIYGTPSIRKAIIDIGCSVYEHIDLFVNVKTDESNNSSLVELQQKLNKVISERDDYVHEHLESKNNEIEKLKRIIEDNDENNNKKLKSERTYYDNQIDKLHKDRDEYIDLSIKPKDDEIAYLKRYISENKEEMNKQKENEMKRLEDNNERYIESLKDQIHQLQNLNDIQSSQLKEYDNKKRMNVVKMGQIGESNVERYISNYFIEGKLKNTAKTGGQGDLHFTYRNCDILLEVKNKDRITPDDISKFERDIQETDCCGGVFISIKPGVSVPCHSSYDIEWIGEKPIMYITNFETLPDMLYIAIKTIYYYVIYKQQQEQNINTTDIQNKLIKHKQEFEHVIDNIKLFKPLLEDASLNVSKTSESITKMQNIIKTQLQCYFTTEDTNEEKLAFILNVMKQKNDHGKPPSYEDLVKTPGISKKDIALLGGINNIRTEYKKFLSTSV